MHSYFITKRIGFLSHFEMRLARVQFIYHTTLSSSKRALPSTICIRNVTTFDLRQYSQSSTSPVLPPPRPTDSTSKSSGLNHQLHPSGRPPLSPISRIASTTTETAASSSVEQSPIVSEYRTPLRVKSSNTPQLIKDTVKVVYRGPFSKAVRGLKAFSISSLILSTCLTPFMLTMEANVPMIARVSMVTAGYPILIRMLIISIRSNISFNRINTLLSQSLRCPSDIYVPFPSTKLGEFLIIRTKKE